MANYSSCPNCGNSKLGHEIKKCSKCGKTYCQKCNPTTCSCGSNARTHLGRIR